MTLAGLGYQDEDFKYLPVEVVKEIFKHKITKQQLQDRRKKTKLYNTILNKVSNDLVIHI